MDYENLIVETRGHVGLIRLNRPKVLNALSSSLVAELTKALDGFNADDSIGAIVITGNDKAFASGADIKEMANKTFNEGYLDDFITKTYDGDFFTDGWEQVAKVRKPVIAAVAGYALGGGCELALMCDIILAADTAKFGQPEITLGMVPWAGGTQRLTRIIGKYKALDMILTNRLMDAAEAERCGLVSRVLPAGQLLDEAVKVGEYIASMSRPSVLVAKELVNRAYETTLAEGMRFERLKLHALIAPKEQEDDMASFGR